MWKFVRKTAHQPSAEREKLQKELFSFRKTVQHGFPNKPTALAWDPKLRIVAIGTSTGSIKVFGQAGVEFYGHHSSSEYSVLKLLFVPNEGKIISLCDGNSLHLWQINDAAIEEIKSFTMDGRVKQISALYIEESKKHLLVGTEGGNIYTVDLETFSLTENIIYQDVAMQNVPEGKKINPGAVEAISEQPASSENLLIGYRRGLMVLWNKKNSVVVQTYVNNQQLESFSWDTVGKKFLSSQSDGSYVAWNTESNEPIEEPITVYGPFPCKAITKIQWCKCADDEDEDLIVFSGGMPRASYSDRHTVTIQQGPKKHVVLDFTSKVIDFFVTYSEESDVCEALIVLLEEELVAIDLTTTEWKTIPLPYLISLHASCVTFLTYVEDVSETVWNALIAAGTKQLQNTHSKLRWPINGGYLRDSYVDLLLHRDMIITGHEDGSVKFWSAGSTVMSLIYTFKTNAIFRSEDDFSDDAVENHAEEEEEEWPPFRKVGCFDPYSDDPRLAVKKVTFCPNTGVLVVGGAAGQVVVSKILDESEDERGCKVTTVNLIPDKASADEVSYQWKGAKRLPLKGNVDNDRVKLNLTPGYVPTDVIQIMPPAAITSLAIHALWHLVAIGTAHGLSLFDFKTQISVNNMCTLHSSDFSCLSEPPISRTKSFKKSLRESFRRIRKGRSSVRQQDKRGGGGGGSKQSSSSPMSPADRKRAGDAPSSSGPTSPLEARPVERAIEARPTDDAMGSMVRCLFFFNTNITSSHQTTPSLWAGTNNGTVYIFIMNVPGGLQRKNEKVHAQLGKEIQLKHRAPVIGVSIINLANKLFQISEKGDRNAPHYVIISSEEQIKLFLLPNLKPAKKLRLTALEGARVRRVALGQFSTDHHAETCLMALTNLGECLVLSLPHLHKQMTSAVIRREDINGISNFAFSKAGEGFYLISSSEIQRITLSTSRKTLPMCSLKPYDEKKKLDDGSRTPKKAEHTFSISNGIAEEDEEEEEEQEQENNDNDSSILKKESKEDLKKTNPADDSQLIFNHDISAITLDSIKDYLPQS